MVRPPTATQHGLVGTCFAFGTLGLAYLVWAVVGEPGEAAELSHGLVGSSAFVFGFLLSVAVLRASHLRAAQRFERGGELAFEASLWLAQLRGETPDTVALGLAALTPELLESRRVCEALLDLARDTRVPSETHNPTGQTLAELTKARLVELAPRSSAWSRAVAERVASDPGLGQWLPAVSD